MRLIRSLEWILLGACCVFVAFVIFASLSGCISIGEVRRETIELHKRLDRHEQYCPHIKACVEAMRRGPGANISAGEDYHLDWLRADRRRLGADQKQPSGDGQ